MLEVLKGNTYRKRELNNLLGVITPVKITLLNIEYELLSIIKIEH